MNARYPDATAEELDRENTCIVCREEMHVWTHPNPDGAQPGRRVDERQRPKKLPCGHILHFSCLRSWLERQQVCPTCRRPVLSEATNHNNQQNQGHPNQGMPAGNGLGMNGNQFPAHMNRHPFAQLGQPAQPGQQGGQQDRPAGNMRVFNFGPIRIAMGNLRLPNPQHPGNANNNPNVMANLAQQMAQNPQQILVQNQPQNHTTPQVPAFAYPTMPGSIPRQSTDIQSDILRLQQNIIDSLRQLNAQHDQLEYIHTLLGELNRLQQASGITGVNGQELPIITPLNPPFPINPQAYLANGPVLRQGDASVPEGLVLPEGWTLRPLALAPQPSTTSNQLPTSAQPTETDTTVTTSEQPQLSTRPESSTPEEPTQQRSPSSAAPAGRSPTAASFSKAAEPSSLESSWSFGNVAGANDAEGSSSTVAGSSTESQNVTRRTVTVEDDEDTEYRGQ
jgi:E3 ubiquitin-protein ligase synoviolin